MAQYNWKDYEKIKSNTGFKTIKLSFSRLESLLSHTCLKNELIILKSVSKRIIIRLRNAKVSRLIKLTNKSCDRFFQLNLLENMNQNISTLVNENYEISSGSTLLPFKDQIESIMETLEKSAQFLRKTVLNSLSTFGHCMPWLRLGHLVPHFLMITSSLSRLNIMSKAILVYVNDLYSGLSQIKDELKERYSINKKTVILPNSLKNYLLELNIKCDLSIEELNNSEVAVNAIHNVAKMEDVGVPISRTEKPEESQTNKSSNKRKRNKKNKKNQFNPKRIKLEESKRPKKQLFKQKRKN